ncbi:NYN domain-containing protein [Oceanomicrobium pacificus]|nr:NYN domain-containing protein [Oceanomicrobium pacificus]
MADPTPPLLAVLIDADNTSARWSDAIFAEIAKIGEASVRRIYGDFSTGRLKSWEKVMAKHAIVPFQQFANTVGKNSSDIALVIDGMDLLHTGRFDGFILVSSDSDFTRLASRIREQGLDVYGIGEKKTPESFRMACKRFLYVENLLDEDGPESGDGKEKAGTKEPPTKVLPLVRRAISGMDVDDEWITLGRLGTSLNALQSDFDPRNYGSSKLSDLLERTGEIEVDRKTRPARMRFKPKGGRGRAKSGE